MAQEGAQLSRMSLLRPQKPTQRKSNGRVATLGEWSFGTGKRRIDKPLTGEGMFIIDIFETTSEDGKLQMETEESVSSTPAQDLSQTGSELKRQIGGGGIFGMTFLFTQSQTNEVAMTCARLFLPPSQCSMVIDTGTDFSPEFRRQLESLGRDMTWFRPREGLTTRALNIYSGSTIGYDTSD
jgi:hypothetical protein